MLQSRLLHSLSFRAVLLLPLLGRAEPTTTGVAPKAEPAAASEAKPKAAGTTTWVLDDKHAEVAFVVDHMMVSKVRGAFTDVSGAFIWDQKAPLKSSVEATIAVASVDTRVAQRNDHLKSADFFDATKYPNITFKSTKIQKKGRNYAVTGDLTIRDVTRPITLMVKGPAVAVKDPMSGATRTAFVATGKLRRKDFGLTWNKTLDKGGLLVGADVELHITAEFTQKMD